MSSIRDFKDVLITEIHAYCGVPIIEAEQEGDKPEGPHATFKITSPFIKGVGQAEEIGYDTDTSFQLVRTEGFKRVLSFSTYDKDADESHELAQKIHDWFNFQGYDFLNQMNVVVAELTSVQNRDIFLFSEYERRNGFDVTLNLTKQTIIENFAYFDSIDTEMEENN